MKLKDLAELLRYYQGTKDNIGYAEAAIHNMMPADPPEEWGETVHTAEKLLPGYRRILEYLDNLNIEDSLNLAQVEKFCETLLNEED